LSLWRTIKREFFKDDLNAISRFAPPLKAAAWSWIPIIEKVNSSQVDRKKDMLLGPLFCSNNYPWPADEFGPLIPLAQFDLANASRLNGEDLGDELLQVFCSQGDQLGERIRTRTIEREFITNDALTEAPQFPENSKSFAATKWAVTNKSGDNVSLGDTFQISGYSQKKFNLWLPCAISDEYGIDECRENLREKIVQFDEIYTRNKESWDCGGFHMFGSFYPIQYYHDECERVFFAFESELGFNFGFDGQGQLFFKNSRRYEPFFYFRWSCY